MTGDLLAAIDVAVAARARLAARPIRDTAAALAEAARRWRDDAALVRELPAACGLTPAMIRAIVPLVAEAIDADALLDLHAREAGDGRPPAVVAHVLASNVPALAVPAITLACLAGAAVVVKSGRADTVSAPAFHRAIAAVDAPLAATIVPAYWRGGVADVEDAVFARADVVVATGADATIADVGRRHGAKVLGYGDRTSVVVAVEAPDDETLLRLALDVARYEQRGCLSPHTVLTPGDPHALAERVLAALESVATALPPPPEPTTARAARRLALEAARFAGATVIESDAGAILVEDGPAARPPSPIGHRTVRIASLARAKALPLPPHAVECVGLAGAVDVDVEALRRHGVARLCPVGRMQRPRIDWPRGQRPALASLFRACGEPRIQVET